MNLENLNYKQQKKLLKIGKEQNTHIQNNFKESKDIFDCQDSVYYLVDAIFYNAKNNKEQQTQDNNSKNNKNVELGTITRENAHNFSICSQNFIVDSGGETDIVLESYQINHGIKSQKICLKSEKKSGDFLKFFKSLKKLQSYHNFLQDLQQPFQINEQISQQQKICKMKTILLLGSKGTGKKLFLKYLANKHKLNYYEKDIGKISSVKHLERAKMKGVNMRPCIIHFRNLRSLMHIITNKVNSEPQKNFLKTLEQFIDEFRSYQDQLNDNHNTYLVFSIDKFNETEANDNSMKSLFDYFMQYQKLQDSKDSEDEQNDVFENCLNILYKDQQQNYFQKESDKNNTYRAIQGIPAFTLMKQVKNSKNSEILLKNLENLKKSPDLESLSIPNVSWDDVGGLKSAKSEITQTLILPQAFPQLFNETFRPRTGLLFFGPPGTGKTLLAKCIATECNMNFLSVKGPELLNMYIGESEKNVRDIFAKARRNPPCVMFFDELDALAPSRGKGSDSSQVMDRIVASFLTEMDEISKLGRVFVIGATNRPDLLDQSLLRPGRFDKMVYLGITSDTESRVQILQAQTRKLHLAEDVNFENLCENIPKNFTGADMYGLTSQSVLKAAKRKINTLEKLYQQKNKEQNGKLSFNQFIEDLQRDDPDSDKTIVSMEDFQEALQGITPSVSEEELQKYEALKEKFYG